LRKSDPTQVPDDNQETFGLAVIGSPPSQAKEPPQPEATILAALERRDLETTLRRIDELYGPALYRFITGTMGNPDSAEDVYQTTLVQIFRGLETFEYRYSVRAWVFAIARNRCFDALKSARRRQRKTTPLTDEAKLVDDTPPPGNLLDNEQLTRRLTHCIGTLSMQARNAILLRYQEGMKYEEIAKICGGKTATIRARVSRALPALRRCLEEVGTL